MPDDVDPRDLDADVRAELRGLVKDTADLVARHLVVAGRLMDEDPERALQHARAAGALAGRVGSVREAVGLTAYAASEWAEALSELRTARRITGRADHLAVLGDCERALGRPERAVALLDDPDVPGLEQAARVELVIVAAGARRDMGQPEAGVLLLQGPARATTAKRPWASRLWYAYADALLAAGREDEAREWFSRAAEQDEQGETDAVDRLLELDGLVFEDLQESEEDGADDAPVDEPEAVDLQALLTAPLSPGEQAPAADEAVPGATDDEGTAVGAGTLPPAVPAPEVEAAPPPAEGDGRAAPAAAVPGLFSHDETPAAVAPRRAGVPVVAFAPPPDDPASDNAVDDEPVDDDDGDDGDDGGRGPSR